MKAAERDINYLKTIIGTLPDNYEIIRKEIISCVLAAISRQEAIDNIDSYVIDRIVRLKDQKWSRKHVYFLIHDLLNSENNLYEGFDTALLEVDSDVIGFMCSDYILPYFDEVDMTHNQLVFYVARMDWLYK